jgi:hypothetical protein
MNPRRSCFRPLLLILAVSGALFGSACAQPASPRASTSAPPPTDASEQTVRSSDGRAAAQLVGSSGRIGPGERVTVHVANRGQVALNHGRPMVVERWNGSAWEETAESRNTAWTMELLQIEPGRSGVEQTWPFHADHRPVPGWYRLTKDLYTADGARDPERLFVRARVEVATH